MSILLENMAAIAQAVEMPVLRPLVGFDKQEIYCALTTDFYSPVRDIFVSFNIYYITRSG